MHIAYPIFIKYVKGGPLLDKGFYKNIKHFLILHKILFYYLKNKNNCFFILFYDVFFRKLGSTLIAIQQLSDKVLELNSSNERLEEKIKSYNFFSLSDM